MKKIFFLLLFCLVICAFVFASGTVEASSASDSLRIISLAPNITEIVYALGAGDNLVGRSDYCNYPKEVLNVECAGNVWQPNVEVIVSLQPDVVLAASLLDPSYKDSMERAGIKVCHILCEETVEGTYDLINNVGLAINREKEAKELCLKIKESFDFISNATKELSEQKSCVYLLGWGMFGDFAATGDTYLNDLIELAGGRNIAKNSKGWSVSQELLIAEDPDLIILPTYPYSPANEDGFRNTEPYSKLTGKILIIDGDIADRQGVRSPLFVSELAKALYPELFQ